MGKHKSDEILECGKDALKLLDDLKKKGEACLDSDELSKFNKHLNRLVDIFEPYADQLKKRIKKRKEKQKAKEKQCLENGGHVGEWTKCENMVDTVIDHQEVKIPDPYWTRTCERCGKFEKKNHEPKEIVEKRIDEQIKELQKAKKRL